MRLRKIFFCEFYEVKIKYNMLYLKKNEALEKLLLNYVPKKNSKTYFFKYYMYYNHFKSYKIKMSSLKHTLYFIYLEVFNCWVIKKIKCIWSVESLWLYYNATDSEHYNIDMNLKIILWKFHVEIYKPKIVYAHIQTAEGCFLRIIIADRNIITSPYIIIYLHSPF